MGEYCSNISVEAAELLQMMFEKNVDQRPSAQKVLQHPWFKIKGHVLDSMIVKSIDFVNSKGIAHDVLLNGLSTKLQRDRYQECWKTFQVLDENHSGRININEFLQGWDKLNIEGGESKAKATFLQADVDKSGDITFNEFLASTFDWSTLETHHMEVSLRSFFRDLDCNDDGGVDIKELSTFFKGILKQLEINEIFHRIDLDGDGVITKDEMQHFLFEPATDEDVKKFSMPPAQPMPAIDEDVNAIPMPLAQTKVQQHHCPSPPCCAPFLNKKAQMRRPIEHPLLDETIAKRQNGRIRSDASR